MAQDFKQIATEALRQCKIYETCIQSLRSQLNLRKQASIQLDTALLQKSVQALTKKGALNKDQHKDAMELLRKDPNAALRTISALCQQSADASLLMKSASADITGGTLVGHQKHTIQKVDDRAAAYAAVAKSLNLQ